jgi:chitinase
LGCGFQRWQCDAPLTGYKFRNGTSIPATAAYYDVVKDLLGAYATPYTALPQYAPLRAPARQARSTPTSTSSSTSTTSSAATTSTTSSSSSSYPTSSPSSTSSSAPTTTTGAPVHQTSVTSAGITCVRIGCYTEGYNVRALTPYATTDYALMSPEICAANCNIYPYAYIGVEYGGECYCGNQINNGSTIVDDSECNMPCDGYPGEYCGAGNRLDMYQCEVGGSSSTSSAAATTSSSYPTTSSSSAAATTSSAAATTSSAAATSSSSSSSSYPASPSSSTSSYPSSPSTSTSAPAAPSSSTSSAPYYPSNSTSSSLPSYPTSTSSLPYNSNSTSSSVITGSSYPTTTSPGSPVSSSSYSQSTTTETITTTTVYTISSCAPTVTNCPYGKVYTDTIEITTTYCPGNPTTSTAAAAITSPVQYTTSTAYKTTVYTITSCAPTVTNCPAKIGQVTTDTIIDYTTVCPVTATETGASWSETNTYYTWTTSSTTTQYVTVKVVPSTATLAPYPASSPASILTLNKGAASGTLPAVYLTTTTATPSQFTGAASSSRGPVAVVLAVVLGAVAFLI